MNETESPIGNPPNSAICHLHGRPIKRDSCVECNAAHFSIYRDRHQVDPPECALWEMTRHHAVLCRVEFSILREHIVIPSRCPVTGIKLKPGSKSDRHAPVVDRIDEGRGYVFGNIRVLSMRALSLKTGKEVSQIVDLAQTGPVIDREDYINLLCYLNRENFIISLRAGGGVPAICEEIEHALAEIFDKQ